MAEVGSAFISLMPSAKGFGPATERQIGGEMNTSGKRVGSKFGTAMKVGALAAVGGAIAVGSFFKDAVGEASDLAESTSKVGVVFGGQAQRIMAASKTSASAMGLSKNAYLDATGTLGNLFRSLDLAPKKAAGMSQQMVKLAGDMASFNNTSPEEALDALRSGLVGETEPLKRFGVNMNEATLKAQALKMGLIKNTKDALDPQAKALAAQALIMDQTKTAQGDFARTSGGLANQQRILAAQFDNVKATVGTALLPIVTRFFNFLTGTAMPALKQIGPAFGRIKTFLAPVIAGFGGGGGIGAAISRVVDTVRANFLPVLQTMVNTFTTVILPAITSLASYLAAKLFPVFQQVWSIIATKVVPIVASLARFFYGTLYPAVVGIVVAVAQRLKPVFDQLVATFKAKVLPAVSQLLTKFREWQPTIQKVIVVVVKIVGWVLKLAASILGKVLPVVIRFAGFLIGVLFGAIIKVIGAVIRIVKFLFDLGGAIVKGVAKVRDFASALVALEQRGLDTVLSAISNLPGRIIALGGKFLDAGKSIIGKFVDGLKNAGGVVSGIAGNVWDALKGLLNSAIGQINSAVEFTIDLPGPKNLTINPPDIPTLAAGGIISRPTMALVGEGGESEAVMPLSRLSAMLDRERAAGAGTGRAVFHIYDRDDVLLGTMEGVADGRIHGANQLAGETARAM